MAETIIINLESSDSDSILEVEPPKKAPPLIIDIEDDDMLLNVNNNNTEKCVLPKSVFAMYPIPLETDETHSPKHWTSDMIKFYNDDWGDEEEFVVEKLQEKMDKKPSLWTISKKDRYFHKRPRSHLKCYNCCQFGHHASRCPEPQHIPKCHMCGQPGHLEKSCPNSICLNCGNHVRSFVTHCSNCVKEFEKQCSRCFLRGHHFINCSDHWRRYHLTIGKVEINIPGGSTYKSNNEMWCCNCGRKGHHQINCYSKKDMQAMPDTFPFVASYLTSFGVDNPYFSFAESAVNSVKASNYNTFVNKLKGRYKKPFNKRDRTPGNELKFLRNLKGVNDAIRPKKKKKKKNKKKRFLGADFIPL